MKTIENKETEIWLTPEVKLNYAHLLGYIVDKPVKEGITINEMRRDMKILDVLEKAKNEKSFELDKEHLDHIKSNLESYTWTMRHKDIITFIDYIESIK